MPEHFPIEHAIAVWLISGLPVGQCVEQPEPDTREKEYSSSGGSSQFQQRAGPSLFCFSPMFNMVVVANLVRKLWSDQFCCSAAGFVFNFPQISVARLASVSWFGHGLWC